MAVSVSTLSRKLVIAKWCNPEEITFTTGMLEMLVALASDAFAQVTESYKCRKRTGPIFEENQTLKEHTSENLSVSAFNMRPHLPSCHETNKMHVFVLASGWFWPPASPKKTGPTVLTFSKLLPSAHAGRFEVNEITNNSGTQGSESFLKQAASESSQFQDTKYCSL